MSAHLRQARGTLLASALPLVLLGALDNHQSASDLSGVRAAASARVENTVATTPVSLAAQDTPARPVGGRTSPERIAGRSADRAGSLPVGSAAYPVPPTAIVAAPWGRDTSAGTRTAPVRTIARAIAVAPAGATIVLRAGVYHESVAINTKRLTIQNYPREAVWLDGSSVISGWVKSGGTWVKKGWAPRFDASPTYTKGAPDGRPPYGAFVNPAYPMAAHPDQVFRDGTALRQVSSLEQVSPATFYLDEATSRLYVGSDPNGHVLRGSDLAKAISVRTPGTVLRGFGVQRYASSVWHIGTITLERPSTSAENLVVADNATSGVGVTAAHIALNRVTTIRNGLMGITATAAYGFRLTGSRVQANNREHFNVSPSSGGFKITRSRGILVKDNDFRGNFGTGLWLDESVYDSVITGNNFVGNTGHGLSLEISSKSLVVDNVFLSNVLNGLKVNDTDQVQVWNNTFVGNSRSINLVQDFRRASNLHEAGHDPQRPRPDPTVSWVLGNVQVVNNVVAAQRTSAICMVCVEDYSHARAARQLDVTYRGNVYNRPTGMPAWFAVWSRGAGNPSVFTSWGAFRSATGQDAGGVAVDGSVVVSPTGVLSAAVVARESGATPLPSWVATLMGRPADSRHFGAWLSS